MSQSILQEILNATIETISEDLGMTEVEFKAMLLEQGPDSIAMKNTAAVVAKTCEALQDK